MIWLFLKNVYKENGKISAWQMKVRKIKIINA